MLSDLIFVLEYLKRIIKEYNLTDLYTNFANTLQQVSQASTPELQEQLKNYRQRIYEAHDQLEPQGWSHSQLQIFARFGARQIVGAQGYTNFQKALSDNAANTPGAIVEINQQREQIAQLLNNTNNILSSLGGLAEESKPAEGLAVIQVVFDEEVSINNIPELSIQSEKWNRIIRAYSMLAKSSPEKITIIAANKSNPFSLWMSTAPLISKAFYHTVKPFIDLYKEVLEAQEHALALEEKKIMVAKKKFELFKDIEEHERKKIIEIMEYVAENYHLEGMTSTEINDVKAALLNSGPELYKFLTQGGKVDATKDGEGNGVSGNFQLEPEYRQVHALRDKIQKLLVAKAEEEKAEKKNETDADKKDHEEKPPYKTKKIKDEKDENSSTSQ